MSFPYSFNKLCDSGRLDKEIGESAIVTAIDYITTVSSPESTTVYFKAALSTEDETLLGNIVTAHVPDPLPENVLPRVQPTVVYNEHLLIPKGMKKIRFQADQYCAAITLSNRSGSTFDFSCALTPQVGSYITQNDCMLRFFITAINGNTITLGSPDGMDLDDLDLGETILLSNPFVSDCQIEYENFSMLYLWGLTFQARNYGEDDILYLKVMMPTENGLAIIKEYERTWVSNTHTVGHIKTPDEAPGEIPAGLYMRISFYTFKTDATVIHANYDYILTVKS